MASKHEGQFKGDDIQEICSKLIFIGQVRPGQKISVNGQYIQENTYLTSLSRTISYYTSGECREKVYQYINDVIKDAFSILRSLADSNNDYQIQICKNLVKHLMNMKYGLKNIRETYKDDKKYASKLEASVQNLGVKIEELCQSKNFKYEQLLSEADEERVNPDEITPTTDDTVATPDQKSNSDSYAQVVKRESPVPDQQPTTQSTSSPPAGLPPTRPASLPPTPVTDNPHLSEEAAPESSRSKKHRNRKTKASYPYSSYYPHYMSNPDDLYFYEPDSKVGVIKKK